MKKQNEDKPACEPLSWLPAAPPEPWPPVNPMANLTLPEIKRAFEGLEHKYPPILSVDQAADLAHVAPGTLRRKASEGFFKDSVSRKKPLLFWRDRFVKEFMK
jgi:hypothetical protein